MNSENEQEGWIRIGHINILWMYKKIVEQKYTYGLEIDPSVCDGKGHFQSVAETKLRVQ